MSHEYSIVIHIGVGEPVHGKDFLYGLKDTGKRFLSMLITTVQISCAATNDSHIFMRNSMSDTDISLPK